jgi:hypothetical protein
MMSLVYSVSAGAGTAIIAATQGKRGPRIETIVAAMAEAAHQDATLRVETDLQDKIKLAIIQKGIETAGEIGFEAGQPAFETSVAVPVSFSRDIAGLGETTFTGSLTAALGVKIVNFISDISQQEQTINIGRALDFALWFPVALLALLVGLLASMRGSMVPRSAIIPAIPENDNHPDVPYS